MVLLSLVTAPVAFALSEAAIFAGMREWVNSRSAWLGKMACCGYCLARCLSVGGSVLADEQGRKGGDVSGAS